MIIRKIKLLNTLLEEIPSKGLIRNSYIILEILPRIGIVNHLKLSELKRNDSDFDHTNPFDYLDLEVNKNVYCKFLLFRTDFNIPISDEEYQKIDLDDFHYDLFSNLPELPTLSDLIGIKITLPTFVTKEYKIPENIREFIIMNNQYDIKLINQITLTK